jgi:hypothetical protein
MLVAAIDDRFFILFQVKAALEESWVGGEREGLAPATCVCMGAGAGPPGCTPTVMKPRIPRTPPTALQNDATSAATLPFSRRYIFPCILHVHNAVARHART